MRKWVVSILSLIGIAAVIGGSFYWLNQEETLAVPKTHMEEALEMQVATRFVEDGRFAEALAIIRQYEPEMERYSASGKQWLRLMIDASEKQGNIQQLLILHRSFPDAFDANEKAALTIADKCVLDQKTKEYQCIRSLWEGQEGQKEKWLFLDVEMLARAGRLSDAITLLKFQPLGDQKSELKRLSHLALLHLKDQNPRMAWDYLNQAHKLSPHDPEIRSYRGKVLETIGKKQLAFSEYLAALQEHPDNLFLIDQAAEFQLRQKNYVDAIDLWTRGLPLPSLDTIWLKALFWSRMTTPAQFNWKEEKAPRGKLRPFINYLLVLKPGEFWDAHAFAQLNASEVYLNNQQATFWLQMLAELKQGNEEAAYQLIAKNPFKFESWNPELEQALRQIISYRQRKELESFDELLKNESAPHPEDTLFSELNTYVRSGFRPDEFPQPLKEILESDHAFTVALLAAGWNEAALAMYNGRDLSENIPDWVAYRLTHALWENRNAEEALRFALGQKKSPELSLTIGELLIERGDIDVARARLHNLVGEPEVGLRAIQLVSELYQKQGLYGQAKKFIEQFPDFSDSIMGKEALARIALKQGDEYSARMFYRSIQDESADAKAYFVRKAIEEKDWGQAKALTLSMLVESPTDSFWLDTLKKIKEEQQK
ncbi:putative uncharacterized protein [Parachlamydia acanthamoebae UV-7]|uniref:Uncharacterized protein n=3 Tax=Parachlamydia TaxID=83551 RepID=F8KWI0_PARAV|nr:hypothetical protein [Parachlamydia acanthamoebae]KIA76156.1 hypothetical protein DB43_AS00260 [Parachlamydia acanthamoebae]CCB85378.1 putative uncharacterized protein [Parachlamydia acanthamoebae UV-7]